MPGPAGKPSGCEVRPYAGSGGFASGVANTPFAADDVPDSHAHGAPAEAPRPKQFCSHLVGRARPRALLAPRHADVIDAHEPRQLDGELSARSRLDPAGAFQAAPAPAHFNQANRHQSDERGDGLTA